MSRILGKGYSFEDVLIVPKYNKVESRRQVDLSTKATRNERSENKSDCKLNAWLSYSLGELSWSDGYGT